jgi:hypothetical protein
MAESGNCRTTPLLRIAWVEFPHLGVEQVVEEERTVPGAIGRRHLRIKPTPPLGFLSRNKRPPDLLRVGEDERWFD